MRPPFISGKDRPDPGERLLAQGPKCTDARREQRRMMLRPEKHEFTFFFQTVARRLAAFSVLVDIYTIYFAARIPA